MNPSHVLLLLVAGLAAGTVNAVAGGGSLITYPALLAVGLGTKPANFTNSVAVSPGYLLLPTAAVGAVAGGLLLRATPAGTFKIIVPFLVIGAAIVLAFQQRLRAVVGHPAQLPERRRTVSLHLMVGLGAVYGGYFGAALGVMLVAGLGLVLDQTLARVNALKNIVSAVVGWVTVLVFALIGQVDWTAAGIVAPATLVGGYVGARVARRLPAAVLRAIIVTFGLAVGGWLLYKALS